MAEMSREKATIYEVYRRRVMSGGVEKYIRQPFDLVTYDDASGQYIQPVSFRHPDNLTFYDVYSDDTETERLIIDTIPWDGTTEIR